MTAYSDVLAKNIRAARSRLGIGQRDLAEQMCQRGYVSWVHQTVGQIEKGARRVLAEELFGLAICLQTSVLRLVTPLPEDGRIELRDVSFSAHQIAAVIAEHAR